MSMMVESPRWLIKKGRNEEAIRSLSWVRNLPDDHTVVSREVTSIKSQLQEERELLGGVGPLAATCKEIFSRKMALRVELAMAMKWMSNLTGYEMKYFRSIWSKLTHISARIP